MPLSSSKVGFMDVSFFLLVFNLGSLMSVTDFALITKIFYIVIRI